MKKPRRPWDWFRSPSNYRDVRDRERELREERMTEDEAEWMEPWMDGSDVGMYDSEARTGDG